MAWWKKPGKVKHPDEKDAKDELSKNPKLSASAIQRFINGYPKIERIREGEHQTIRTCRMMFDNFKDEEIGTLTDFAKIVKRILSDEHYVPDKKRLEEIYEDLDPVHSTAEGLMKALKEVAFAAQSTYEIIDREKKAMKHVLPDEYRIVRFLDEEEEELVGLASEAYRIMEESYGELSFVMRACHLLSEGRGLGDNEADSRKKLERLLLVTRGAKRDLKLEKLDMERLFKIYHRTENMILALNERFEALKGLYGEIFAQDAKKSAYDDYRERAA